MPIGWPSNSSADTRPALIAAISGRALAASASRAGDRPCVLDLFADEDTAAFSLSCQALSSHGGSFDAEALAAEVQALGGRVRGLVYGSGFESMPGLLTRLAGILPVLGNPAEVVARVKDPFEFAAVLARLGLPHPEITCGPVPDGGWLRKAIGGAGGAHVVPANAPSSPLPLAGEGGARLREGEGIFPRLQRFWHRGGGASPHPPSPAGWAPPSPASGRGAVERGNVYFQRRVPGRPVSVCFLGDGRRAACIGFSEQWTDGTEAAPFRYGGCAGPAILPPDSARMLTDACGALVAAFSLIGLNSLDLLVEGERFQVIEINPRPGASLDIFDGLGGLQLWRLHLDAIEGRGLPAVIDLPGGVARAAAVIYAPCDLVIPDGMVWPGWAADRGRAGSVIGRGDPVSTVSAEAPSLAAARDRVEIRGMRLLELLAARHNSGI